MKIAPIFITEKMMINRLTERNNKIAAQHVKIAENLPKRSIDFLQESRLSLAKYARRHDCRLSFVNGKEGTQMNVERQNVKNTGKVSPAGYSKEGEITLPNDLSNKKGVISVIRSSIKSIMDSVNSK